MGEGMCAEIVYQHRASGMSGYKLIDDSVAKFCAVGVIALWAGNDVKYLFHVVDFFIDSKLRYPGFQKDTTIPKDTGIFRDTAYL